MLPMSELREIPDEIANRMMVSHGSAELLRALRGEPEEIPHRTLAQLTEQRANGNRKYVPVAERRRVPIPNGIQAIIDSVCTAFDISPEELRGTDRAQVLVVARSVAVRLMRDRTWGNGEPRNSLTRIGSFMSRDHSTISHALEQFPSYCARFPEVGEIYERLRESDA